MKSNIKNLQLFILFIYILLIIVKAEEKNVNQLILKSVNQKYNYDHYDQIYFTGNKTKNPKAMILTVVEVDQSKCRVSLNKDDFYKNVALFTSSEKRTCAESRNIVSQQWSNGYYEPFSGHQSIRSNDRYVDETWYFFQLGYDIRTTYRNISLTTKGIVKGIYLPMVHYSEAPTTGENSLYLYVQFDGKLFENYQCGASSCGLKCNCDLRAHNINIKGLYENFNTISLDDLKRYVTKGQAITYAHWNYARIASDSPNMGCPSAKMCQQTNIWGDIVTLIKILKTIITWFP